MQTIRNLESEIPTEIDPMNQLDINLNAKFSYQVKVGAKFGTKNTAEEVKKTGKRYKTQDNPFYFFKETEAYDAARSLGGKVVKL